MKGNPLREDGQKSRWPEVEARKLTAEGGIADVDLPATLLAIITTRSPID